MKISFKCLYERRINFNTKTFPKKRFLFVFAYSDSLFQFCKWSGSTVSLKSFNISEKVKGPVLLNEGHVKTCLSFWSHNFYWVVLAFALLNLRPYLLLVFGSYRHLPFWILPVVFGHIISFALVESYALCVFIFLWRGSWMSALPNPFLDLAPSHRLKDGQTWDHLDLPRWNPMKQNQKQPLASFSGSLMYALAT